MSVSANTWALLGSPVNSDISPTMLPAASLSKLYMASCPPDVLISPDMQDIFLLAMDRVVPVVENPGQHSDTFGGISKVLRDTGEEMTTEVLRNTKLKLYAGVELLRGFEGD